MFLFEPATSKSRASYPTYWSARITFFTNICINSLPYDNFLDKVNLKAFADDKSYAAKIKIFLHDRVEILWKKEKMLIHFLLLPQCFLKAFFLGVVKSRDWVVKT